MDAVWPLLVAVALFLVLKRLMPGLGAGWGPKKECGWTPPDKKQIDKKQTDKKQAETKPSDQDKKLSDEKE